MIGLRSADAGDVIIGPVFGTWDHAGTRSLYRRRQKLRLASINSTCLLVPGILERINLYAG